MQRIISSTPFQYFRLVVVAIFSLSVSTIKVSAQEVPVLEWAKATEGPGANNTTLGVAADGAGNVYTTGSFSEATDFDPGPSVFTLSPGGAGGPAAFISKLDANGNFLWAKAIERPASSRSVGKSIAVTSTGDVYISGDFTLTADFDPGPGVFNLVAAGNDDSFILKLDADGNFVWAVRFGNSFLEYGNSIATDAVGNVYAAGLFGSVVDFDPGLGISNLTASGSNVNAYIVKLNSNGNLIWAKALGGTTAGSSSQVNAMCVDAANNVHVTGRFSGTVDFDPGIGTFTITGTGGTGFPNAFVTKLNNDGDLVWAKSLGGTLTVEAYGISVDLSGNVLTTGVFVNTLDVDPGAGVSTITSVANSGDIYISKLDINGNFVWGKGIGSTGVDHGRAIATDALGNVYTTGFFYRTVDFDPGAGIFNLTALGGVNDDFFISKLDSDGNFVWAVNTGGINRDRGNAICIDPSGAIYVGGFYSGSPSVDFDFGPCVLNLPGNDSFVEKITLGTVVPPPLITSFTPDIGPIGTTVTLLGTDFSSIPTNNGVIFFNNRTAIVTASTPTSITTTVPASSTTGKISVTVNCMTVQSATNFIIGVALVPTITSFTPTSGVIGTTVTITGTNFNPTPANNTVAFNGTTAVVTASTATSITTSVPNGATTGTITVTIAGNTATSSSNFTVTTAPVISIITQPSSSTVCDGVTTSFTTAATGTTNIAYQWKFSTTLAGTYTDINNGGGYTNVNTASLSVNTTGNFGAGFYRCRISGDLAASIFSNAVELTINAIPAAPTITNGASCGAGSVTLVASGGVDGQYRWYTTATGGVAIAGEVNSIYVTPSLTTTTTYFVSINNGCESLRTPVTATVNTPPAIPTITSSITLTANTITICSTTTLTLSAPNGFASYSWSNGATTSQINVSASGSYSVIVTDGSGCSSPASDVITVTVVPAPCNNSAPVINNITLSTTIGNTVSIDLSTLISDADNNLVLSSLTILQQTTSGAQASLNGTTLQINYAGISFTGTDVITIRVCDEFGECSTQQLQINVIGEIEIFNGVSNNNDGKNDFFKIANIDLLEPENIVTIYNRWGSKVFEVENYNEQNAFRGFNKNGNELPSGTYFYKIFLKSSGKTENGYLVLKR